MHATQPFSGCGHHRFTSAFAYSQRALGLPRWLSGKESACQGRRHGSIPGSGRSPPEMEMATHSNILAWNIPSLVGYSPWGFKRVRHDCPCKNQNARSEVSEHHSNVMNMRPSHSGDGVLWDNSRFFCLPNLGKDAISSSLTLIPGRNNQTFAF